MLTGEVAGAETSELLDLGVAACAADETTGECPILDALDEDPDTDSREDAWKDAAST